MSFGTGQTFVQIWLQGYLFVITEPLASAFSSVTLAGCQPLRAGIKIKTDNPWDILHIVPGSLQSFIKCTFSMSWCLIPSLTWPSSIVFLRGLKTQLLDLRAYSCSNMTIREA